MSEQINEQFSVRKDKLEGLRGKGVEAYPNSFEDRISVESALERPEGENMRVAGRIMSKRVMGKAAFAHIQDSSGKIQVYVRLDKVGKDKLDLFKDADIGDFFGISGGLFVTRTGEKTVLVEDLKLLSKSLRPLPEKWHKLKDTETRYRQRYLDILVNEESSRILKARAGIIKDIRNVLYEDGFTEVETPMLQSIAGGAAARPFRTHHNAFDSDLYLRIAPELYLKRLLVGGWDRVFEIGRNFRNEGISTRHNPEFTMMEVYCAYTDFRYMMALSRKIVQGVWKKMISLGFEPSVDFSQGWEEKNLWELISEETGVKFDPRDDEQTLKQKAEKLDIPPGKDTPDKIIDRVFSKYVEDKLQAPVFVTGYLSKYSPLAKRDPGNEIFAERFEIFAGGRELGNAYSEQNDPAVQRRMFEAQVMGGSQEDADRAGQVDNDYLEALEYGMPPASGLGIGIDRLVMLMTGVDSIREVILFPMLRPIE